MSLPVVPVREELIDTLCKWAGVLMASARILFGNERTLPSKANALIDRWLNSIFIHMGGSKTHAKLGSYQSMNISRTGGAKH
jgi:hypothetical protein